MAGKWKLNRAGLFNFWYYDDEIFEFADGKLLLRGANGSGKSVTMQSLLPVLLDGKKTPDRLDPFGSRSRRMEDYLLGEKEVSNRDERTGYLFIEYKMEGTEQYLTTGMGMQAKRNQPLKSWGFVITDNRRIGYDLELYKVTNHHGERKKFPYSQTELANVIGIGGEVASSNQEYMRLINRYVFGFETIEAFEDLIKLLIQLRSPKLSKDFKPTVIYEILEEALPPLTDEDLRYLSDSIEQMDQTKQQMEQLEREVKALTKLKDAYEAYSERIFADLVKEWKQARDRADKEHAEVESLREQVAGLELEVETGTQRQHDLKIRQSTLSEQRQRLEMHEVFKLEEELQKKRQDLDGLKRELASQHQRIEGKMKKERDSRRRLDDLESEIDRKIRWLKDAIQDLDYEAGEGAFAQHEMNVQDYEQSEAGSFGFENWNRELDAHRERLEAALDELRRRDMTIQQFQDKNRELSEAKQAHDTLLEDESKWQRVLSEEKQGLIHRIHVWLDDHDYYQVSDPVRQQMMRMIDLLFTDYEFEDVKELFRPFVETYEDRLRIRRSEVRSERDQTLREKERLQEEWSEIKAKRDPEPARHEATVEARKMLESQKVTYKPLYELVEFKPEVPDEVQKRLESALAETGLLDALVTTESVNVQHDRILGADPKLFTATLADYLQPDRVQKDIPADYIEMILQSIEMNGDVPIHFTEEGRYRLGSLHGHALPLDEVRFIGREARKRYREKLLAELEEQMKACDEHMGRLDEQLLVIEQKLGASKEAWSRFPTGADVRTCYHELEKISRDLQHQEKQIKQLSDQLARLDQLIQESRRKLMDLTRGIRLELRADAYSHALAMVRQYEKRLHQIQREHDFWVRLMEDEKREREQLIELQDEIDELRGELASYQDKATKLEQQIEDIRKQQELKGAEEVRREISHVIEQLSVVDAELNHLAREIPTLEAKLEQTRVQLDEGMKTMKFWTRMKDVWEESVLKEWKRGLIALGRESSAKVLLKQGERMPEHTSSGQDASRQGELALAKTEHDADVLELLKRGELHQYLEKKDSKERSLLEADLTKLFYNLQPDLTEYKMIQYTDAPEWFDWMKEVDREEWKPVIEQWKSKSIRNIIEFDQRGVKISPAALFESVSRELSIQETRLDELDKQLYEEILFNSVGHKLRARIRRAEQWTEQMRELMESRDTSSGLRFSIRWKPKTADSEEELDTQDLVTLLKRDARVLSDEDRGRISRHFRSKIQAAKLWMEEKGEGETLLQVLKMVLDYRKWFTFVLYYERSNEPWRELTNHHFFKFSGGEKAMAMYIPLFTACYSRYQEAAPSAPYIITLDEAFAGVDENNINEMFEIVEQLGFNYIMNSQVLWGDYESVKSLSVCELVRPKNADYVTVIRYKWNGKQLVLLSEEEE